MCDFLECMCRCVDVHINYLEINEGFGKYEIKKHETNDRMSFCTCVCVCVCVCVYV